MPFTTETAKNAGKLSTRRGSPNIATKDVRESFRTLLESNLETLQDDIRALEPKERVKIVLELAKFVLPTLKATELNHTDNNKTLEITFIKQ